MSKNRIIIHILLSTFFVLILSCNSGKKNIEEVEVIPEDIVEMRDDQIILANIEMGAIEMKPLNGTIKVNGIVTVAPKDYATVCAPLGGFVKSINFMPGNVINKGQILAVVENQEFVDIQQNYLEAKNKLEFAKIEFDRHSELFKEDVYSEQNLQQVTVDFKNLKAQVNALEQKLVLIGIDPAKLNEDNISRSIVLVSPIKGYLAKVNVTLGKFVSPNDILFEVINNDKLYLELSLFEKDAEKVENNQNIMFFINNEPEMHKAVITQTGKSIDTDKILKVFASISGTCKNVLPGMYVNAMIETSGTNVTALPSEAFVNFDDKDYIFVFDKNKEEDGKPFTEYKIVEVQKGISYNGYTEISLPVHFNIETAKIVIKGAYNLLSAKKNAGEMAC